MTRCAAEWIAGNVQTSTDDEGRLQFEIPEHGKNSANHWNKIFRDAFFLEDILVQQIMMKLV